MRNSVLYMKQFRAQVKKRILKKKLTLNGNRSHKNGLMAKPLRRWAFLLLRRIQNTKLCFIYEVIVISEVAELKSSKAMTRND